MSVSYEDFFPLILPEIAGAPEALVVNAIRNSCIEFCEKSLILTRDHDPITVIKSVIDYDLEPPSGYVIYKIMRAWLDSTELTPMTPKVVRDSAVYNQNYSTYVESKTTPQYYLQKDETTITLWGVPENDYQNGLTLRVVLKPSRASTSVEDVLFENYAESIAHGALYRLMLAVGRPYSNPQAAAIYNGLYRSAINSARLISEYGHVRAAISASLRKI